MAEFMYRQIARDLMGTYRPYAVRVGPEGQRPVRPATYLEQHLGVVQAEELAAPAVA